VPNCEEPNDWFLRCAAEGSVARFQDHQRRAAECLRLAHEATDKTNKALLIEMAQTWAKLAELEKARSEDDKPQ